MLFAIAIEQVAKQTATQIRSAHGPVCDRERQVHVVLHHDALIVVGGMVAANGVDEGHIAYKAVLMHMTAVVKGLVHQVLRHHGHEYKIACIGVDDGCGQPAQNPAAYPQRGQNAPGEKHNPELLAGINCGFVVGEVLVMLAGVAFVDFPQSNDVDASVHHITVHGPFNKITRQKNGDHNQPFPTYRA